MIAEALEFSFFQRAIIAGLLSSVACGVIGSYVVVKRMSSISGGLSHAAFGGVGIGYYCGFSPMLGAACFAVVSGIAIGWAYLRQHHSLDTLIAIVWAMGMGIGVMFIAITPGYAPDLTSYLFGNILLVPTDYIVMVAIVDVVIILVVGALFKLFQAVTFDEEFSNVAGVNVEGVFLLLLVLTSLVVVILIRIVGVVMLIALLTTPAIIARQWSNNLKRMMIYSSAIAGGCTTFGLFLSLGLSDSYGVNLPTGPLIIMLTILCFVVSSVVKAITVRSCPKIT